MIELIKQGFNVAYSAHCRDQRDSSDFNTYFKNYIDLNKIALRGRTMAG